MPNMAVSDYPLIYRICFLWIEPFFALGGSIQTTLDPITLLKLSLPGVHYTPDMWPLMFQFAGSWMLLFYQKVITLRKFPDHKVWRDICIAHCISDVIYLAAYIADIGIIRFLNPFMWTLGDWITNPSTLWPLLVKLAFIAGWGLKPEITRASGRAAPASTSSDARST